LARAIFVQFAIRQNGEMQMDLLATHFASISRELKHKSERVRDAFKTHRATVGENREAVFKTMKRQYSEVTSLATSRLDDSLFIVFAFEAAQGKTCKNTVAGALQNIPTTEQPDFIVVANSLLIQSGSCFELAKLGQPNSNFRKTLFEKPIDPKLQAAINQGFEIHVGEHTLMVFFIWLTSWLKRAGRWTTDLHSYLPLNTSYGITI
jgi:hypothetical protein